MATINTKLYGGNNLPSLIEVFETVVPTAGSNTTELEIDLVEVAMNTLDEEGVGTCWVRIRDEGSSAVEFK